MSPEERQHMLDKAVLGLFGASSYCSTFLVTIYCSLKVSWDEKIPTACTNGIWMKINPHWFRTLSLKMRVTLLAHELWHIAYLHMTRGGHLDFRIFNMAADYAINIMLSDHGYTFDTDPVTGEVIGLLDPQYRGMTTEQIYDHLIANAIKISLPFGEDFCNTGSEEESEEGLPLTPEEVTQITSVLTQAALAEHMTGTSAGNLPGEVSSLLDKLLRPAIKWTNQMDRWLTEQCDDGYTWAKPNRRYREIYLPSQKPMDNALGLLIYAIDCSGSLTDPQLQRIVSELKGVQDKFQPARMLIVSFDTRIQDTWDFEPDADFSRIEIHGRGGTDMQEVFALAAREKPQALIMFSDMDCWIPPAIKGVETLWCCLDRPHWEAPYGRVIHIDSSQDF